LNQWKFRLRSKRSDIGPSQNKFCTPISISQNKFGTKIAQNKFGTKIAQNKFGTKISQSNKLKLERIPQIVNTKRLVYKDESFYLFRQKFLRAKTFA